MSDLTPEMLAELRRLLDGGPLRPWTAGTVDGVDYGAVWGAVTKRNGIYVTPMIVDDVSLWPGTAELIAAAVNALPALLDAATERDALAATVERVRALADWHETKADKARRFRIEINGENRVMDKAAEVHDDAARRLRRALDEGAES